MKVTFVSQWYAPELGDGGIPRQIAVAMRGLGHQVDVLTGFPNYPSGTIFPGYRLRPYQLDEIGAISVHRAPLYFSHDDHAIRRAANYLSFAAGAAAVGLARVPRADVSLVYSSPITAALPAVMLRSVRRTPYVLMIQDMWPQTVTASGMMTQARAERVEPALHRLCDAIYRRAAAIAVTSPGMIDLLTARGVDRARIRFVPNWADEQVYRPTAADPSLKAALGLRRAFIVMYAGNLGEAQHLETVLDAAALLRDREDVGFAIVGGGVAEETLRQRATAASLPNVVFVPPQPVERMSEVLAVGDVQLVCLKDAALFRNTMPSKVQSLLAAGRPILGSVSGDAARVIEESGAGYVVPPASPAALAGAVLQLRSAGAPSRVAMGEAGRIYYETTFWRLTGAQALADLLQSAATG